MNQDEIKDRLYNLKKIIKENKKKLNNLKLSLESLEYHLKSFEKYFNETQIPGEED